MRKRMLSWTLVLALCLTLLPASALAEGDGQSAPQAAETVTSETFTVDTSDADLPNNDELFAAYVQQLMYPQYGVSLFGSFGESVLTGLNQEIYQKLKNEIGTVASFGGSAEFTVKFDTPITWSTSATTETQLNTEASQKFNENIDTEKILDCLLADCPYELYWFDKTVGVNYVYSISSNGSTASIPSLTATFSVAAAYQGEDRTTVDASLAESAEAAIDNAKAIVTANSGKSPYQQMKAYKEEICRLTSYNYEAANNTETPYGDPWQLIYVFDGKSDTKVVCEGYAKAFQYLCDLANLTCYTVTGIMEGGTGAGDHMWNIVTLDGSNYLVDVTNCDGEEGGTTSIGYPDLLFLKAPTSSNAATSYTFTCNGDAITYTYDDDTTNLYSSSILTLAGEDYQEPIPEPGDVDITSLTIDITAPVKGATPVTTATITDVTAGGSAVSGEVTVGSVTWNPDVTEFAPGTAYTAALTLTAPSGYQFTGDTAVTVEGSDSVGKAVGSDGATLTVTVMFPATDPETPAPVEGLTRAELAQLLYDKFTPGYTLIGSASFDDIDGLPQETAILALAELNYITGTGENQFSPTATVNAAGAATLMARIITGNSGATSDALVTLGILTSAEAADTTAMQDETMTQWLARFVTRAELAAMVCDETYTNLKSEMGSAGGDGSHSFTDLSVCTEDQKTAIGTLFEKQILSGTGATTFNPTGVVTRAEAAVVLWRAAGSRSNVKPVTLPYIDVVPQEWYAAAINCLYAMEVLTDDDATGGAFGLDTVVSVNGLTSWLVKCNAALGRGDLDEIAPVGGITRAEMAEKVYNDYQTLLASLPIVSGRETVAFTDISGCTEAQKAAIGFFYQRGIINGTTGTTFTPYAAASNAQIAMFLYRCATAANSGSSTDTVTETAGDGTLQASLLHYAGEWYATAVQYLIDQGGSLTINKIPITSVEQFTNPDAPGIGTEMTAWNDGLKPTQPTISCTNGTVTITGKAGETVYYTTDGSDPIDNGQVYTTPFTVSAVTTVTAVAVRNNMVSARASETCQPAPSELTVTLSKTLFTYNGSFQTPATITVKSGEIELTTDDYTVSYSNSNGGTGNTTNAGTVTVTVTGTDTGSYAGKTGTATYTIAPAELTIKAKDQTITYGGSIVQDVAQCTVSGLCSPDTLTSVTLTASTTDVTTSGVITPSAAVIKNGDTDVATNYTITYQTGTLVIQKANLTVAFQGYTPDKTYDGEQLENPAEGNLTALCRCDLHLVRRDFAQRHQVGQRAQGRGHLLCGGLHCRDGQYHGGHRYQRPHHHQQAGDHRHPRQRPEQGLWRG